MDLKQFISVNIGGKASIKWDSTIFTIEAHLQRLAEQEEHLNDESLDDALSGHLGRSQRMFNLACDAKKEGEKNRLPLTIRLEVMELPVPPQQVPVRYKADWWAASTSYYCWTTTMDNFREDYKNDHPLFSIARELMRSTMHEVDVRLNTGNMRTVFITFYSDEDIYNPPRFLQALAHKMERWANG